MQTKFDHYSFNRSELPKIWLMPTKM